MQLVKTIFAELNESFLSLQIHLRTFFQNKKLVSSNYTNS